MLCGVAAVGAAPASGAEAPSYEVRVEAVGHSLPGRTATGLPVGKGIVAVDDVASAITGWIIDLWFPSLHEAGAWGRKSVVITVYR